jgi:hypothetical protein
MRSLLLIFFSLCWSSAMAQVAADTGALAERSELLPAGLSMDAFTETSPEQGAVGDAHLFATPFYGPQVYLLVLRLDFEETAPPLRSNRISSKLGLRPAEQRVWVALIRLPGDRWPADGKPEILASLLESLVPGCEATPQVLASSEDAGYYAESDGTLSIGAFLASWRQQAEPVLAIAMRTGSDSSGGGTHLTQAWYLSNGRYELEPLACAPLDAGYWSKPSYDAEGNVGEEGADVSVTWTLQPGKPATADPTPLLELREHRDPGNPGRVVARYRWGSDSYLLQPPDR